jgi:hypothetical protein
MNSPGSATTSLVDDGVGGELDLSVIERFRSNRRVNDFAFFCLVAAYCVLIVFGTIGNSLVVYVVARQPAMRTARNVFVVNLAISDLLLCLITMPLTVSHIYSSYQLYPGMNIPGKLFVDYFSSLELVGVLRILNISRVSLLFTY